MAKITMTCAPDLHGAIPSPVPAIKSAPYWFKAIKPQVDGHPQSGTAKRCVPFLDALSQGFIIPLWADMFVRAVGGEITIDFPRDFPQQQSIDQHSKDQLAGHPLECTPYGSLLLKFINPWLVKTEPGISCLFTSPQNHMETRFKLVDGLVDTDTYANSVNLPFIWTGGDGEFFIQRGTPLVQVIPVRRETFDLDVRVASDEECKEQARVRASLGTKMRDGYRDMFWHKRRSKETDAGSKLQSGGDWQTIDLDHDAQQY